MNNILKTIKESFIHWGELLCALFGVFFVTVAATWESPIYKGSYGYDASFFSMMGRAILAGKVPYKDYFDIKGPVFFFIEAFGQLICKDRLGVYIIECIACAIAFVYIYKLCKLYKLSVKKTIAVFVPTVFVYFTTLWGGNTVEEFLLPLNYACIYYGILYLKGLNKDLGLAFLFGITAGMGILSKITVVAPMAAITLVIFIYLIINKQYKSIVICALLFFAGVIVVAAPVCLYFIFRNAFDDFVLAAFITAFKRSTDYYEGFSLKWESCLAICYAGFISSIIRVKYKGAEKWILLSLSLVIFAALHLGTPFEYYFTTTLPIYTFLAILICRDIKLLYYLKKVNFRYVLNSALVSVIGLIVAMMIFNPKTTSKIRECFRIYTTQCELDSYNDFKEIFSLIPEYERSDVFCIESGMIVYEVNQELPANKYPVNFPYFTELYPPSKLYVMNRLAKDKPKWIVAESIENFELKDIRDYVLDNYIKITDNSRDQLWLLKE